MKKAKKKFEYIKILDDVYAVPTNEIFSKDIANIYLDSKIYSDLNLVKDIKKVKFKENDCISIM